MTNPSEQEKPAAPRERSMVPVIILWLIACFASIGLMARFVSAPGQGSVNAATDFRWPAASKLGHHDKFDFVLFCHPRCPCTRATINELNVLLARCPNLNANIVFMGNAAEGDQWSHSETWEMAQRLPRSVVLLDTANSEARLFGAKTSGQTYLFDSDGRLLFSGGITGGRGHEGDNAGLDSVVTIVKGGKSGVHTTEVYGCSLF